MVSKPQILMSFMSHIFLVDLAFVSLICRFPEKNITGWRKILFSTTFATLWVSCLSHNNFIDVRSQYMKAISLGTFSVLGEESSNIRCEVTSWRGRRCKTSHWSIVHLSLNPRVFISVLTLFYQVLLMLLSPEPFWLHFYKNESADRSPEGSKG